MNYFSNGMRCSVFLSLSFFVFLLAPRTGFGQMFSVKSEESALRPPEKAVYIGWEPADFSFDGDQQKVNPDTRYDFDGSILRLRVEIPHTHFYMGYGENFSGIDSVRFVNLGGKFHQNIYTTGSQNIGIYVPFQLRGDLTIVSNERKLTEPFSQSSVMAGLGPGLRAKLSNRIYMKTALIPHFGFSLSPGGTFGGQSFLLEEETRLYIDELLGEYGISVGYDYRFLRYNIEVNMFDYKLKTHSFLIGVTF